MEIKEQTPNAKEQLVNNIKEWIKLDNEITQLKAEIKTRNDKKKTLTENLVSVMKTNSIDCFDINGGALVYKNNKMTYNQAFPKLYIKLKQHNITYNSLTLIDKLKKVEEKYGEIKDSYLDTIVNQILASKK